MAYENYQFVSWSKGTPITGERLAQMSTNIEQVKEANDDKPVGIIRYTANTSTGSTISDQTETTIASLTSTNSVTLDANRYYKVVVNFPGIRILGSGNEDTIYELNVWLGDDTSTGTKIGSWKFTPHTYSYIPTPNANIASETLKSTGTSSQTIIGAGTYTIVGSSSSSGLINQGFVCSVKRTYGASFTANTSTPPNCRVESSSTSPVQLFVEDAGGVV